MDEHNTPQIDPNLTTWLAEFQAEHGRPLRILHVGNIAGNAYLNAKLMRRYGVDAHVMCFDYYHVMGCPEWEDVRLARDHEDDFKPKFYRSDLKRYKRPRWFVQGPLLFSLLYLDAYAKGSWQRFLWWRFLFWAREDAEKWARWVTDVHYFFRYRLCPSRLIKRIKRKLLKISNRGNPPKKIIPRKTRTLNYVKKAQSIVEKFDKLFPERRGRMDYQYICKCLIYPRIWQRVFNHYDLIQCYGASPMFALLYSKKKYVGFEHGTLRNFTGDGEPLHNLIALAYRSASHVFITNGDCLQYAKRLNIKNYSGTIHPIDVDQHRRVITVGNKPYPNSIKKKYQADVLLYCPVRHDWEIKGTDYHIRALPKLCAEIPGRVVLILARWGNDVAKSEALINELNMTEHVKWVDALCRLEMISYLQAADVLLEQMVLPVFGSTSPQSLAAGTPVVMSYKPEYTEWLFSEPAPILSAFNIDEVVLAVKQALDPDWLADFKNKAKKWIDTQHHAARVMNDHLTVYRKLITEV